MRSNHLEAALKAAVLAATILLLATGVSLAQSVNLTAGPTAAALPDSQNVPMWGYSCTGASVGATCTALNPNVAVNTAGGGWSPVVITVPASTPSLTINLTNNLPAPVPTSLVIVGQLGGGLGAAPTKTPSPNHPTQVATWPIAGTNPPPPGSPTFTPPAQAERVQSFATEVANGATATLTWTGLKPGTYLIESGTHPSIQGPMGLYGVLVVTTPGTAYPATGTTSAVTYGADVPLLLSEIDAVQNNAVNFAVHTAGFSETAVWSGQPGACGDPTPGNVNFGKCYPPAVNYDPRYYLVNGVAFDRTHASFSSFATTPATGVSGTVLVRFVNAGLRMHVPSIVGAQTGTPAVPGFSLIAEDGNVLPGNPKVQSEVFLPAGKTYDVLINAPAAGTDFPVFDRQLSLSTNNQRDGGMQAYVNVNGGALPGFTGVSAVANPDAYILVAGTTLAVSDPAKGVIANDIGVYGVKFVSGATLGHLTLNADGTFTYVPNSGTTSDSFVYCANGSVSGTTCSSGLTATVTLASCATTAGCIGGAPTANPDAYISKIASRLQISPPGVLANDTDPQGHPLKAAIVAGSASGGTVTLNADGSFTAVPTTPPTAPATATVTFRYNAVNSQNTPSATPATVTVIFGGGSGLNVAVKDANTGLAINDYRWIIEEDRTIKINPATQVNTGANVTSVGTNFHTSYMPVVASGCVGAAACESGQTLVDPATQAHNPAVCDVGNGACRTTAAQQVAVNPSQVALDPTKSYYISIFPGDAGNSFSSGSGAPQPVNPANPTGPQRPFSIAQDCGVYATSGSTAANWAPGTGTCGHTMGGAPITTGQTAVTVNLQETPLPTAKVAVFVFEDDSPLNGEPDAGGGNDAFPQREVGLGEFEITLFDDAGGPGDATGQMTYDMFNMPLSNSLAGLIDPQTGLNACPISPKSTDGLVGMIVTCPKYESDGTTLSPLMGQAIIAGLMPGRYGVVATPGADRIARGEEWLQTNTLDGQKAHDAFIKQGEPAYFQEFGPAGFHVSIGFANPAIINSRLPDVCANTTTPCTNSVTGMVTTARISRTPDERIYSSGSHDALGFTQCYVSLGDPDGDDIAFTKCNADGTFTISGIPDGTWRITIFDQWNDTIVDGLATPVALAGGQQVNMGNIPVQQWHTNIYTRTFFDLNGDGVSQPNEPGLTLLPTNIRFRDGSYSNFNNTDLNGYAGFNEIFPLFNWYVIEADTTRYKQTGVHVVYDAGGPADGTAGGGTSTIAGNFANTKESASAHLPTNLRVPGAVYCDNADCNGFSIKNGPSSSAASPSTGRIDPPWVTTEGWQGFTGQNEFIEFGKKPFAVGENGGIKGEVIYASTRPFDDPTLLLHTSWTPDVPGVTINLYQEGTASDGTQTLKLVDTTKTSSWDDWAQGFRSDGMPNMNCPGQETTSPFYFTVRNSPQWLNPGTPLPNNAQFKCYDGMAMFNQVQPAPYDGMYQFPSVTSRNPVSGLPTGTNCTICVPNPTGDGTQMLPAGKYVVEMIVPPGYELVKEEDKNILIGDNYIAPVTQQFGGLAYIFILPDQAEVATQYNRNNPQNPTQAFGRTRLPSHEGDTGSVETFWPCVGQARVVPDYISLFPQSQEVAPFAGATRNLCDRKEVTLEDQTSALAKFWVFTSTHVAAHYTGIITDDFSSEFDPFSPAFGEKFAVPNLPISMKDFNGVEIARTYSDQWGSYSGLNYSTWEVNPPNPTGYAPTMMVACMNDPGTGPTPDPLYNPGYSQFCYEIPFMPGQTQYMDTPVVPTMAFAEGYNPPDCNYPDATPAIKQVDGDGIGPWVSASGSGHTLTITALGDQLVPNHGYSGPQATTAPFNQKFIKRHYGFGSTAGTVALVGSDGVSRPLTGVTWSDGTIRGTVPSIPASASTCTIQQRGVSAATQCAQLVITAANGKVSIDTVTVTIGGKAPTRVNGENPANNAIQTAIDSATPGDLIMVGPGTYNELLLMWKPVRLQGVGAASVTVNANTHPAGKMDIWRREVNCLFGLSLNGGVINNTTNPYDPTGTFTCPSTMQNQVDPIPGEAVAGWDASQNGNIAELLQEPTLMGAYEGAAVTVLGQGVVPGSVDPILGTFTPLNNTTDCSFQGNFLCNPARIDGMSFTNSSQGGGGIFLHGWQHFMEISNNRVFANAGSLTGGIVVGQQEVPPAFGVVNNEGGTPGNTQLPYGFNKNVRVHNNSVTQNVSYGDELFSATPSSAGGVTFCTGSDNYHFNYNWVCGNLTTGDGGGFAHLGFSYNGEISHNSFLFNQSNNPSIPTAGGGVVIEGLPSDGTICENSLLDVDCPPSLSEGIGPGLVIDANLIMGNTAESGSGGGLRLQSVNGTEVTLNPTNPAAWYGVRVTNNIIANNVAGWDGGGVSLQDALKVDFINNTVIANDSTASAGVLFNTLQAPLGGVPPPGCDPSTGAGCNNPVTTSTPQPAGFVATTHSPSLLAGLPATVTCPANHFSGTNATNANCRQVSYPLLENNLFWQNRSFNITVPGPGSGLLNQQNLITLVPQLNQAVTGACVVGANYWDIGVRGDTGPTNHASTFTLAPRNSILTSLSTVYSGNGNLAPGSPGVVSQYCNGSRVPPENGGFGYQVPPGISDATVPNPVFNLTPAATVDEGNNWVNMSYGPLSMSSAATSAGSANYGKPLGNYMLTAGATAINAGTTANGAPTLDFFGRTRTGAPDIGAVEFVTAASGSVLPASLNFGQVLVGQTKVLSADVINTGDVALTVSVANPSTTQFTQTNNCPASLALNASCTITVTFVPTLPLGTKNATLTVTLGGVAQAVSLAGTAVSSLSGPAIDATCFGDRSTAGTTIATAACSTIAGNELLLAYIGTDAPATGTNTSVTAVSGGGLTWVQVRGTNVQRGDAEIWRAFATAPLSSFTVTATLNQSVGSASITVISYTGVDTSGTNGSGAIGNTGSGNANPGAPTASLTTTRANSWVFGVGNDWDNSTARTLGANQTMFHQFQSTATGDDVWVQGQSSVTPLSGTSVTINDTAPATDRYNLTIVEVLPPTAPANNGSISGTITPATLTGGTTVTLTQGATTVATTVVNASGDYSFIGLANGTYTVTPSKTGFTFTPVSQNVTVNGVGVTGVNFTMAAIPTSTISGTIAPAASSVGSTVTLTQGATTVATTTVAADGTYSFTAVANGTYTVTPTKTGFTFTPASQSVTVSGASVTGVNFTIAAIPTFGISGTITPAASSVGSTVTLTQGATTVATTTVAADGTYSFTGLANGTYTVTPTKTGFSFTPASQSVTVSGASVTGVNFTVAPATFAISGTITPTASGSGSTLTLTQGATTVATTTAAANGTYSFTGLANGTYTVTPTKTGFSFTPVSQNVTIAGANITGINFTIAAVTGLVIDVTVFGDKGTTPGTTVATTPAFSTTTSPELLLAFVSADNPPPGTQANNTTVTGVAGGGLTWTLVSRSNGRLGTAEVWRALASTPLTGVTVTATLSKAAAASITVVAFHGMDSTGTNGSGAIGATASLNAASGAPSGSIVTTRANSLVYMVGTDWDSSTSRTVPVGQVMVHQFLATVGDTYWVQRQGAPTPTAGTTVTMNDTAPTADRWDIVIVEVRTP